MTAKLINALAATLNTIRRIGSGQTVPLMGVQAALALHAERLRQLCEALPSGSGFDGGTQIDHAASRAQRIVFTTAFHHMDEHGCYDGWSEHQVIVTPDLAHGFSLRVTGRDRNGIKEYIADVFHHVLTQPAP